MNSVNKYIRLIPLIVLSGCATTATSSSSSNASPQDTNFYTSAYQLVHFDLLECSYYRQNYPTQTAKIAVFNQICDEAAQHSPLLQADAAQSGVTLPNELPIELRQELVVATYEHGQDPVTDMLQAEVMSHVNSLATVRVEEHAGTDPTAKALAFQVEPLISKNLTALQAALSSTTSQ